MNPLTREIKLRKCAFCITPFSEFHHYYPQHRRGEKTGSFSGIYLCPNHHKMANALQLKIERLCQINKCGADELAVDMFSDLAPMFDNTFNRNISRLIMGYHYGEREYLTAARFYDEGAT